MKIRREFISGKLKGGLRKAIFSVLVNSVSPSFHKVMHDRFKILAIDVGLADLFKPECLNSLLLRIKLS